MRHRGEVYASPATGSGWVPGGRPDDPSPACGEDGAAEHETAREPVRGGMERLLMIGARGVRATISIVSGGDPDPGIARNHDRGVGYRMTWTSTPSAS